MPTSLASLKPLIGLLLIHLGYAGMTVIARFALEEGMNHFVFVAYKEAVATMAIAPFAYFLERNNRPVITCATFCQIFVLAMCGITVSQNFYLEGLRLTSATFASAISNITPVFVFVMATAFGMEKVDMKSKYGHAQIVGTIVCVGGAMFMTFYKGPVLLTDPNGLGLSKWMLGAIMLFLGCLFWSGWVIFQAPVVRKYPAQLSLTAIMLFQGTLLSILVALIFKPKTSGWRLKWDFQLLSILYSGLCSSFGFVVQFYCIRVKGPIFVTMFHPTTTVLVAILELVIFHINFHLASLLGAILIVTGLYMVLWGKANDHNTGTDGSNNSSDVKQFLLQDDTSHQPLVV
eukprot:PITA_01530